jgi:hypothetical protein
MMMSDDVKERVTRCLKDKKGRRVLLLGGSVLAASTMGFSTPDLAAAVHGAFLIAVENFPLQEALATARDLFLGAKSHVATVGIGIHEWATSSGVELARIARDAVVEMKIFMGDAVEASRDLFEGTISTSRDFATFWFEKAGEAVATTMGSIKGDLPGALKAAGEKIGGVLVAVAEIWGVYKALEEAHEWSLRRLGRRAKKADPDAEAPSVVNVGTIQINIAIGGEKTAQAATADLEEVLKAADISIPEGLSRKVIEAASAIELRPVSESVDAATSPEIDSGISASDPGIVWMSDMFKRDLSRRISSHLGSDVFAAPTISDAGIVTDRIEGGIILKQTPRDSVAHFPEFNLEDQKHDSSGPTLM